MDALSSVLSSVALRAGVFYSGNICGLHDFEHDVFKGHLHLIERGPIVLKMRGQADLLLVEPTLVFLPRPQWHRLLADDVAGADVVCGTIALGGGVHNPVSASLPDVVQVPLSSLPGVGALLGLVRQEAFEDQPGQAVLDRLCEVLILQLLRHCMAQGITLRRSAGRSGRRQAGQGFARCSPRPRSSLGFAWSGRCRWHVACTFCPPLQVRAGAHPCPLPEPVAHTDCSAAHAARSKHSASGTHRGLWERQRLHPSLCARVGPNTRCLAGGSLYQQKWSLKRDGQHRHSRQTTVIMASSTQK